jgi:hypothetical protein
VPSSWKKRLTAVFSIKSKVAVPKTEVLGQPQLLINISSNNEGIENELADDNIEYNFIESLAFPQNFPAYQLEFIINKDYKNGRFTKLYYEDYYEYFYIYILEPINLSSAWSESRTDLIIGQKQYLETTKDITRRNLHFSKSGWYRVIKRSFKKIKNEPGFSSGADSNVWYFYEKK